MRHLLLLLPLLLPLLAACVADDGSQDAPDVDGPALVVGYYRQPPFPPGSSGRPLARAQLRSVLLLTSCVASIAVFAPGM